MLDDMIVPFGHHGAIDDVSDAPRPEGPKRIEIFGIQTRFVSMRLIAQEWLECYRLWTGSGRTKCIVCDLDGTLWSGVLVEQDLSSMNERILGMFKEGPYGGIHQALKILKDRGILLATASKNNHDDVISSWKQLHEIAVAGGVSYALHPDDFVCHEISWDRKIQEHSAYFEKLRSGA